MSRDSDITKTLGGWLGKAKQLGQPPEQNETKGTLSRPEMSRAPGAGDLAQLNFKIANATKKRIKQLAVRDNITMLTMLDRMLCALRTWAAFKPAEMKAWIATVKDPPLRKALTWTLTDPWGPG